MRDEKAPTAQEFSVQSPVISSLRLHPSSFRTPPRIYIADATQRFDALHSIAGVAEFAARRFGSAAGVPLETWVYHQDRDAGIGTFEIPTREAIEFFSSHIGPYPYDKLAAVETAFSEHGVSIKAVRQEGRGEDAQLVVVSHEAPDAALAATVQHLREMEYVRDVASVMRVARLIGASNR